MRQKTTDQPGGGPFHIKGLDGIRALSVAVVFIFHLHIKRIFPGKFAVNVFFLLSGFLITTLMIREHAARGRISIKEFYLRRALRIFPPMYIVILCALLPIVCGFVPRPLDLGALAAQCLHLTNYYMVIHNGWDGLLPGMSVLWSLAVEEHFYLVFPFVFAFAYGRFGPRRLALALLVVALGALAWRAALVFLMHSTNVYRTSMSTDTRIDSILWGCILALWRNPALDPEAARPLASGRICGIALVVLAGTLICRNDQFRETLRYTLESVTMIPVLCAAILRQDWLPVRLLNAGPLRWLGRISYTFYLSHYMIWQLFVIDVTAWPRPFKILVSLCCTLIFCQLMRVAVEIPLSRIRKRHGGA